MNEPCDYMYKGRPSYVDRGVPLTEVRNGKRRKVLGQYVLGAILINPSRVDEWTARGARRALEESDE